MSESEHRAVTPQAQPATPLRPPLDTHLAEQLDVTSQREFVSYDTRLNRYEYGPLPGSPGDHGNERSPAEPLLKTDVTSRDRLWHAAWRRTPPELISDEESDHSYSSQDTAILLTKDAAKVTEDGKVKDDGGQRLDQNSNISEEGSVDEVVPRQQTFTPTYGVNQGYDYDTKTLPRRRSAPRRPTDPVTPEVTAGEHVDVDHVGTEQEEAATPLAVVIPEPPATAPPAALSVVTSPASIVRRPTHGQTGVVKRVRFADEDDDGYESNDTINSSENSNNSQNSPNMQQVTSQGPGYTPGGKTPSFRKMNWTPQGASGFQQKLRETRERDSLHRQMRTLAIVPEVVDTAPDVTSQGADAAGPDPSSAVSSSAHSTPRRRNPQSPRRRNRSFEMAVDLPQLSLLPAGANNTPHMDVDDDNAAVDATEAVVPFQSYRDDGQQADGKKEQFAREPECPPDDVTVSPLHSRVSPPPAQLDQRAPTPTTAPDVTQQRFHDDQQYSLGGRAVQAPSVATYRSPSPIVTHAGVTMVTRSAAPARPPVVASDHVVLRETQMRPQVRPRSDVTDYVRVDRPPQEAVGHHSPHPAQADHSAQAPRADHVTQNDPLSGRHSVPLFNSRQTVQSDPYHHPSNSGANFHDLHQWGRQQEDRQAPQYDRPYRGTVTSDLPARPDVQHQARGAVTSEQAAPAGPRYVRAAEIFRYLDSPSPADLPPARDVPPAHAQWDVPPAHAQHAPDNAGNDSRHGAPRSTHTARYTQSFRHHNYPAASGHHADAYTNSHTGGSDHGSADRTGGIAMATARVVRTGGYGSLERRQQQPRYQQQSQFSNNSPQQRQNTDLSVPVYDRLPPPRPVYGSHGSQATRPSSDDVIAGRGEAVAPRHRPPVDMNYPGYSVTQGVTDPRRYQDDRDQLVYDSSRDIFVVRGTAPLHTHYRQDSSQSSRSDSSSTPHSPAAHHHPASQNYGPPVHHRPDLQRYPDHRTYHGAAAGPVAQDGHYASHNTGHMTYPLKPRYRGDSEQNTAESSYYASQGYYSTVL